MMKNIKKQYNIYKTTNFVNGKFYWGVHDSIDEKDGYFGSGTILRKAIKKYGKENFRRVTKLLYDTAKEAYEDEGFIVDKLMVENPMSYNSHVGGKGGSLPGKDHPMFGRKRPEHSKRMSGENNPMFGIKRVGSKNPMFGQQHSEESILKMSFCKQGQNNPNSRMNREKRAKLNANG